jgi:FkbM family methyltransferase
MSIAIFDLKLQTFRLLKEIPVPKLQTAFRRKYYGRLRAYTSVDIETVFSRLPAEPTIVDLGANDNLFLPRNLLDQTGEIHAVEADPLVFEELRKNVGSIKNVKLYNVAIGAGDGEVTFYRNTGFDVRDPVRNSVGSSIFAGHQAVSPSESITVPQLGILTFLKQIGKRVDLMKIDIEGAEVPVLETLLGSPLAESVSIVLVETHEHVLPELVDRTDALRRRAAKLNQPKIDMNWK